MDEDSCSGIFLHHLSAFWHGSVYQICVVVYVQLVRIRKGYVYFLQVQTADAFIKIGFTIDPSIGLKMNLSEIALTMLKSL